MAPFCYDQCSCYIRGKNFISDLANTSKTVAYRVTKQELLSYFCL